MKFLTKANFHKLSWFAAVCLTVVAVLLHFFSMSKAGGLWRDEIGLVNIAALPNWKEIVWGLMHDHCPVVFPAIIRMWAALGLAHTVLGLRVLGLCVGLFLLASFWVSSRMMGKSPPLISLSLAALNPVVIRYGDSMRAYAFGTALMMLAIGLMWRFIEKPSWRHGCLAGAAAVASVQTLYQNAFFLLAICGAGALVSFRQRQLWKVVGILSIGLVAALSLVPYIKPIHDAQTWWLVSKSGINLAISLGRLYQFSGNFFGVWVVVLILAATLGIGRVFIKALQEGVVELPDLPLFGGIAIVLGATGFGLFIKLTGLPTQAWYYIPALCFTTVCCDGVFPRVHSLTRFGILIIAVFALIISPLACSSLRRRQTDGDLLAAKVSIMAAPKDFIIVQPWYYGITFDYYYHGTARWTTLPPISDHSYHRYDLIKEQLQTSNAIASVLDQARATLQSGHRVWVIGDALKLHFKMPPAEPPIAPNGPLGWVDQPYNSAWADEAGYFLKIHAVQITQFSDDTTNPIPTDPMESMTLTVASGWQTNSPAPPHLR